MDDERRQRVRQAALEVFLRFGYRKVNMDDIARGAGLSRPSLYLVFPNKEAVFRDVVKAGLDDLLEKVEQGLPKQRSLEEQLAHVFQITSVGSFELVARAPAAKELMNASFDFVSDLFEGYEQRRIAILARLMRGAVAKPDALRPTAEARARVMIAAAHGFKAAARDPQEMQALVGDLVEITVAGLPVAKRTPPRKAAATQTRR
jgi:AcrR family transcriptional regulator